MPRKGDGRTSHPFYYSWRSMRQRCKDPNFAKYDRYGGRGITVAPEWEDFWRFVADIGPKPDDGRRYTLERINNDGNYEPGNVRWATYSEQNANRKKLDYPAPKKCNNGHDYEVTYDGAGNRRCKGCIREKRKIARDNKRS